MPYTRFLLSFLILLVLGYECYATDFVVTSNADAGPGTLREALTLAAANGTTTADLINETSDYYVSYNLGSCESPRTKVHVEVVLVDVKFPSAFSPNADGVNDYWKIEGLQKFPGTVVSVFNRGGQKVFESRDYARVFDGTQNGNALPAGVYYYIINLKTTCALLSGNVTILR